MGNKDKETCENCRFFNFRDAEQGGECRKKSPTLEIGNPDNDKTGFWPMVEASDFCGDWKTQYTVVR